MADKKPTGLPLETDDAAERALWQTLGEVAEADPSPKLRQDFYRKLEQASHPTFFARLRDALGFSGNTGWVTATACVLVGLGTGVLLGAGEDTSDTRLAALEQNITLLNRRLILDRLEDSEPSKRLRGVIDASYIASTDAEVANALLKRATEDRVGSVRSAAIDALGASISAPAVGEQLMPLLQQADSPIVQLALVDLVLRYGNKEQIEELKSLAQGDALHPDLQRYVTKSLQGETA